MTGVQRSAHEIVSRLLREDTEDYRLVSPRRSEARLSLPVRPRGRIRQGHLWEQLELPGIVRRAGPGAVLYSPMTSGPVSVSRQVMTVHDLFVVENPEWFSRAFGAWYRWLIPRLVRRAAYVLANSRYTRERLLERYGLPEEKVVLCYFAQDERFSPVSEEEVALFRAEQGLPERYLLALGSIEPRKNLATLAAAWKRTGAREQGVELLVGGASTRRAVHNAAGSGSEALQDPTIRVPGYLPDEQLPLLYGGAEAFVHPSLAEGFGLPILEAMACGTPVICSNATALPEISGGAARLVPAREIEAWTDAIDAVVSDPTLRRRMRESGLQRAAGFDWSRTANTVRGVLRAV